MINRRLEQLSMNKADVLMLSTRRFKPYEIIGQGSWLTLREHKSQSRLKRIRRLVRYSSWLLARVPIRRGMRAWLLRVVRRKRFA